MNQEITYSSSLINFLNSDQSFLEISDQKNVWRLIKQNYVVSDDELKILQEFGAEIVKLPSSVIKQELQNFLDGLINNKARKRRTYNVNKFCDFEDICLTLSSSDKIYFNPIYHSVEVKNILKKYPEIEVHNVPTFLKPEPIHRLKHLPTIIKMEEGCYYDIKKIFGPFLKEAKNIRVEDPYLPNEKASKNLWKLISSLNHAKIKLVFFKSSKYVVGKNEDEVKRKEDTYKRFLSEVIRHQNNGLHIDISEPFLKKSHRERWIFTEDFQIYTPGGLDFLSDDGFFIQDKVYNQDVESRNQIKIEERDFDVKFN